jgi:hypothetical protein
MRPDVKISSEEVVHRRKVKKRVGERVPRGHVEDIAVEEWASELVRAPDIVVWMESLWMMKRGW